MRNWLVEACLKAGLLFQLDNSWVVVLFHIFYKVKFGPNKVQIFLEAWRWSYSNWGRTLSFKIILITKFQFSWKKLFISLLRSSSFKKLVKVSEVLCRTELIQLHGRNGFQGCDQSCDSVVLGQSVVRCF